MSSSRHPSSPSHDDASRFATARREYRRGVLAEATIAPDPFRQFRAWLDDAMTAGAIDATAMVLATADRAGRPAARVVLLKELDARGFVFYGDARSLKGSHLAENPHAALCFYWAAWERQVRVRGRAEPLSRDTVDAYFRTRPRESQVGAWASEQSAVLPARATLEARVEAAQARFAQGDVPLPPHWSGWRVVPEEVEFWQGREGRLHDRLRFRRERGAGEGNGERETPWILERLSP